VYGDSLHHGFLCDCGGSLRHEIFGNCGGRQLLHASAVRRKARLWQGIHHSVTGCFAIRQGKWKLSLCPGSGAWSDPKPGKASKGLYPVQLCDLEADLGEQNNLAEKDPERVKAMADLLAKAIRDGRSTPGAKQENEGWPGTTPREVLELLPQLKP